MAHPITIKMIESMLCGLGHAFKFETVKVQTAENRTRRFAAMLALWPPNPNELLTAALTSICRAVFGT